MINALLRTAIISTNLYINPVLLGGICNRPKLPFSLYTSTNNDILTLLPNLPIAQADYYKIIK